MGVFGDASPYVDMTRFWKATCKLEDDDYPPYWPPGTPPVSPSWSPSPSRATLRTFKPLGISSGCVCTTKEIQVAIHRDEAGNLGFNLRYGNNTSESADSKTLVITRIKPGGPAFRCGCIKVGDRLLTVNGVSLLGASLQRAHETLRGIPATTSAKLTLEVDVSYQLRNLGSQMLVELHKFGGDPSLGISLAFEKGAVVISAIKPGSVAFRSCTIQVGDQILSVNGCLTSSPAEVLQSFSLSGETVQLKILAVKNKSFKCPSSPSMSYSARATSSILSSSMSTLKSQKGGSNSTIDGASLHSRSLRNNGVSHCETLALTLHAPPGAGYGIVIQGSWPPVIAEIEPGSPADSCGCLQPGDRILIINQTRCDCLTGAEAAVLLSKCMPILKLHIQFDVAEAVVPSSGVFMVKLARRGSADLGIFVSPLKIPSSTSIISKIRRGSVAHRSGALHCGDQLLEICGAHPGNEENVIRVLEIAHQKEIVSLKVLKGVRASVNFNSVERNVHTVDLVRLNGPLGLTISGTEQRDMPITISALKQGGLAESTGSLYVGDRLLTINGHDLQGYKLSEAIDILQRSKDTVTLQVARPEPTAAKPCSGWDCNPRMPNFSSTESELSMVWMDQSDDWESTERSASVGDNQSEGKPKALTGELSSSSVTSCLSDVHKVILYKDGIYEDFGFSVSDGLYERGVYINRIRNGGPASKSAVLQPFDRILQVNGTSTQDFDCCLTVPLIAAAGDQIELLVARNPFALVADLDQRELLDDEDNWIADEIDTLPPSFSLPNAM